MDGGSALIRAHIRGHAPRKSEVDFTLESQSRAAIDKIEPRRSQIRLAAELSESRRANYLTFVAREICSTFLLRPLCQTRCRGLSFDMPPPCLTHLFGLRDLRTAGSVHDPPYPVGRNTRPSRWIQPSRVVSSIKRDRRAFTCGSI